MSGPMDTGTGWALDDGYGWVDDGRSRRAHIAFGWRLIITPIVALIITTAGTGVRLATA